MTSEPLAGFTIGITAERRQEEFAAALERRGATVISAPAIKIVPLADDSQLHEATRACLERPLDIVVVTTGIGFRGWVEAATASRCPTWCGRCGGPAPRSSRCPSTAWCRPTTPRR